MAPDRLRVERQRASTSTGLDPGGAPGDSARTEPVSVEAVKGVGPPLAGGLEEHQFSRPGLFDAGARAARGQERPMSAQAVTMDRWVSAPHTPSLWVITPYCWHCPGLAGNSGDVVTGTAPVYPYRRRAGP